MMKYLYIVFAFVLLLPSLSQAQCKSFTKKKCIPQLGEYSFNGQLNTAVLTRGEEAELMLSFYSGQKYRMYVCAEEQLGDVEYEIMDIDRNVIYSSKDKDVKLFDFKVPSTQQLILHVMIAGEKTKHALAFQGCVSILVGFIEDEKNSEKK